MPKEAENQLVLHAASEVVGFAKTGGLADVAGSLPRALAQLDRPCAIITPLYRGTRQGKVPLRRTEHELCVPVGGRPVMGWLWEARLPGSNVPVYLVEQPDLFERDDPAHGFGLYQYTLANGQKQDYPDNCARFVFFARAVLEAMPLLDLWPTVLHNHDWQAGLVPVYLREEYAGHANLDYRPRYQRMRCLFTIHNLAYQGLFRCTDFLLTGLDERLFNYHQLEFYGQLNFLKAGIVFSDWITTVSPTYAAEIQTPTFGCGLQGVLTERKDRLSGIVNGVDYGVWNPEHDPHISAQYTVETVAEGKARCKAALQQRLGLPVKPDVPLLGMVSRLVEQKGLDLLAGVTDLLLAPNDNDEPEECQLVILGDGDPMYHHLLLELQARYPERVHVTLAFDERLAHQIEAGADIYLMPSQYEPSGLNQLYSLKYGTVPVVRATGGLADTIVDCTPETLAQGTATGFAFVPYTPAAFLAATRRAMTVYRHDPDTWRQLQRHGMTQDWSWDRSARAYEELYRRLLEEG
ncbi:MAG: glycogen synthase GlgA [Gemmataceae bacterium]